MLLSPSSPQDPSSPSAHSPSLPEIHRSPPLLTRAVAFALGLGLIGADPSLRFPAALWCSVAALASVLLRRRLPAGRLIRNHTIPLLLGIYAAPLSPPPVPSLPDGPHAVTGRVAGTPRPSLGQMNGDFALRMELVALKIDGIPVLGTLSLRVRGDPDLGRSDRIRCIARATAPGSLWVPHPDEWSVVERSPLATLDRARRLLRQRFRRTLPSRAAAWSCALLLGDRALLSSEVTRRFRAIGQGHLLAISGLHVGLLIALVRAFERRLPGSGRRRSGPIGALALLGYAGLAGADPPVMRAALFGALAMTNLRRSARPRLPELLVLALFVLGSGTGAGGEVSFWLSFAAVTGIALTMAGETRSSEPEGRRHRLGRSLRIACGAWLGAHVVLVWITPEVVPLGPLISLCFAPWLAAMLAGSILALIPGAPSVVGPVLEALSWCGEGVAGAVEFLPGTPWTLPPMPPIAASAVFAATLAMLSGRRRASAILLAVAIVAVLLHPVPRAPRLLAPNLGRGQGAFILGRSATILLDAGSLDHAEGGARTLRDRLWRAGRDRIDLVVLSHPHADHVLAIPGLLKRIRIGAVAIGPRFEEPSLGWAIERAITRAGVPLIRLSAGGHFRIGEFDLVALHPAARIPDGMSPSVNDDSLVVRIRGEGIDLLAPGDLEGPGLASVPAPGVRWLLLPHHGREAPGLVGWLRGAAPELVLTLGGGPPSEALRRVLAEDGIRWRAPARGTDLVEWVEE